MKRMNEPVCKWKYENTLKKDLVNEAMKVNRSTVVSEPDIIAQSIYSILRQPGQVSTVN